MKYIVYLLPIDPKTGDTPASKELDVARFHAEGDAIAYAIWRATVNNNRLDVFEVRKSGKKVYRAG